MLITFSGGRLSNGTGLGAEVADRLQHGGLSGIFPKDRARVFYTAILKADISETKIHRVELPRGDARVLGEFTPQTTRS